MRTLHQFTGDLVYFIMADLDPAYHDAARHLVYSEHPDGFAKSFPADSANLDRAYANFTRYAEAMLRQAAGVEPVPWQTALVHLLDLISGQGITWYLVGSAALAVRGIPITPGDIDLATDTPGAFKLAELLRQQMVEPLIDSTGWICRWFCRTWLGARVEWIGEVADWVDDPEPSDYGPVAQARAEVVTWHGYRLRVPPLDLQLRTNEARGRHERAAAIRDWLAAHAPEEQA